MLHQAIDLLNRRTLDTKWYGYPSLPAYLTAAALIADGPIYRRWHGRDFRNDLPSEESVHTSRGDNYDLISPPELILAGRWVALGLSVGTVVLAGAIATRLAGRLTGLLAMFTTAVCPSLVSRASNVIVDTFATFFVLLALYFCERMRSPRPNSSWRGANAIAAGMAVGLAFASKYTAGAVFVAVLTAIWTSSATRSSRAGLILLAGAGLLIATALAAPAAIFHLPAVVRDVSITAGNYEIITSRPGYFGQAISSLELGWPLTVAGCFGLVLMVRERSARYAALSWFLFAIVLLALFLGKPFQPFRNLLPLVPPYCIAAAIAFAALLDWARRGAQPGLRAGLAGATIAGCLIFSGFSSFQQIRHRMAQRDTRIRAIDWLQQQTTKESTVLGIGELAFLPEEWKRIAARSVIVPWQEALELLEREQFDYVVTGEFDLRHAADPSSWSAYRARWNARISPLQVEATFGQVVTPVVPYLWRTNDERILLLRGNAR